MLLETTSQSMELSQCATTHQFAQNNQRCIQLEMEVNFQRDDHGGPWSKVENTYQINYLEMLAAFLALQCFIKEILQPLTVYLHVQMDNTTAISYLNHKGGIASLSLASWPNKPGSGACLRTFP